MTNTKKTHGTDAQALDGNRPSIDIVYFTFNRIAYTRQTLPALIENAQVPFALTIIDNGSTDGTIEYLGEMRAAYPDTIRDIILNVENKGLAGPTNDFWKGSSAEFVGKVDNDTLVPAGWLRRMLEAHEKSDKLGVIGGYHFNLGYVDQDALERRSVRENGVGLVPDAFIGGCCYLMRRSVQVRHGFMDVTPGWKTMGWTGYQRGLAKKGYVNGYLFPLLLVEHFDDPLSEYNLAFSDHLETSQISMGEKGISDREELLYWYAKDAKRVEAGTSLRELGLPVLLDASVDLTASLAWKYATVRLRIKRGFRTLRLFFRKRRK
jgi:glycosyltransferase involved in cell wall biosynthesis